MRRRKMKAHGCFALLLPIAINAAHGASYYVSNGGNDSNPGTQSRPWATIEKVEKTVVSGDSVYLHRGSRWIAQFNLPASIMEIDAYGEGPAPAIDGSSKYFSIVVNGKSHIKIRNLELVNAANDCIRIDQGGTMVSDILIENNTISNCKTNGIRFSPSNEEITTGRLPYDIRVLNNSITNCGNAAVMVRAQSAQGDNRIAHNKIDNVGTGQPTNAISLHYVHNIIVEHNVITNTKSTEIDGSGITADYLVINGKNVYGSGSVIRHNSVECPSPPINEEQAGVAVWYQPNVEIHDNTIKNCNDGIRISGESSVSYNVHHNRIVGARKRGFSLTSRAPKGQFKNNTLSGSDNSEAGISSNKGSEFPDASDNEIRNFRRGFHEGRT